MRHTHTCPDTRLYIYIKEYISKKLVIQKEQLLYREEENTNISGIFETQAYKRKKYGIIVTTGYTPLICLIS